MTQSVDHQQRICAENEIAICDRNQAKGKQQLGNENGNRKPKKERMSYTKVYGTPLLFTGKQGKTGLRWETDPRETRGNGKQGETRETNEGKRKTALRRKTTAGNSYENSATAGNTKKDRKPYLSLATDGDHLGFSALLLLLPSVIIPSEFFLRPFFPGFNPGFNSWFQA